MRPTLFEGLERNKLSSHNRSKSFCEKKTSIDLIKTLQRRTKFPLSDETKHFCSVGFGIPSPVVELQINFRRLQKTLVWKKK